MNAIDTGPYKDWPWRKLGPLQFEFTDPKPVVFDKIVDDQVKPEGRPWVETYTATHTIVVTLGRDWDREQGELRCALYGIHAGQCSHYRENPVMTKRVPLWPWTARECEEDQRISGRMPGFIRPVQSIGWDGRYIYA